jgi:CRP/FNR family transcriptional regulator, cyclic AMP receptor protein
METFYSRPGQSASGTTYSKSRLNEEGDARRNRQRIFRLKHNGTNSGADSPGGDGYQKLKNRLTSGGLPESIIDELLEQPTIVSYRRGAFIFLQGAPTDLLFWVSSGLVDILSPGADGEQFHVSVLGPGDLFGFVESTDQKGRPAQAFQARARTNVQIGLLIRERINKVLTRQDPLLLVHITEQVIAAWSELTLRSTQFLGENYSGRLEMVLAELATKFGVKDSRGTLLIPEFGHNDFAEMIGCSRPMVSRLIAEMISAGRLAQHGKHYIIIDGSAVKNGKRSST